MEINSVNKKKIQKNLKFLAVIYDRGYVSLELMLNTEEIGSKYLIQLKRMYSSIKENISVVMME